VKDTPRFTHALKYKNIEWVYVKGFPEILSTTKLCIIVVKTVLHSEEKFMNTQIFKIFHFECFNFKILKRVEN
jgi:hypothetical protein